MLSVSQAAEALSITRQCVYAAVKHGRLTPIEGIPTICFKEEDIEYYRRHYKRLKRSELRGFIRDRNEEDALSARLGRIYLSVFEPGMHECVSDTMDAEKITSASKVEP